LRARELGKAMAMWLPKARPEVYIDDELYAELRSELALHLLRTGHHDPDTAAVHVLGEIRGVWPRCILKDVEVA
jgi:hypothetical protein